MRRPTSDARQRETRRLIGSELNSNRRRNSSVPFSNGRFDKARYSQDSETDFLCDRAVEFMDSGDICSIVAVELAEQSIYFERLLRYHHGRGCIRLPEFLNAGFSAVIEYIRRGSTTINQSNVYEIFIAADYLLVSKLKEQCSNYIQELSNEPSIAINLWVTGRSLHWPEIGEMAFQKILENFENNWRSCEFAQLEENDVKTIIMNDSLNCKSEMNVFNAIMEWLAEAPETRTQGALSLLWNVRLGMAKKIEIETMKQHQHLQLVPIYESILNEWPNSIHTLMESVSNEQRSKLAKPRFPHQVLCVFGGWCDGEGPRAAAQIFNPQANTWTLWTESGCQTQSPVYDWLDRLSTADKTESRVMDTTGQSGASITMEPDMASSSRLDLKSTNVELPAGLQTQQQQQLINASDTNCLIGEIPRRVYAGCVAVENRVYLVGGFDGTNALKSTLCYDFQLDSGWYEISCMYEKRYYVSIAYARRYIYALGGHNGENQGRLDTAERYNMDENLWQPIASMNRIRSDAAAAELKDRVYIAGGFEGRRYHDSAEYYEPESNQWTLISRMHSPRGGISLAAHGGFIYAIGGNDGNSRLRSIERFDPDQGKWEIVGQMNRRKSNLSSAVLGDDIYIIGGWSDEPEAGILSLVERFDTQTKECSTIRTLTFPASATCACTLSNRHLIKKYVQPMVQQSQLGLMATEDARSGLLENSLTIKPASTDQLMGSSANNADPSSINASVSPQQQLSLNNSVNNLFTSEPCPLHRFPERQSVHMESIDEVSSRLNSDMEAGEEDLESTTATTADEEVSESSLSGRATQEELPFMPTQSLNENNNHSQLSYEAARECFVRISGLSLPSQMFAATRRSLRSRRNRQ